MTDAEIEALCIEAGLMHRTERGGIVLVFAEDLSRPEMVAGVRKLLELRDAEAAAPGLNDGQRRALEAAIRVLSDGNHNTQLADFLRPLLTRASAATVAEPSPCPLGCEGACAAEEHSRASECVNVAQQQGDLDA